MKSKLGNPRRPEQRGASAPSIKFARSAPEELGAPAAHVIATANASASAEIAERRQLAEQQFGEMASTLAETFSPSVLKAVSGEAHQRALHAGGFKVYLDRFLAAAGNPTDPLEIMLIEQLVCAHFQIGNLMAKAANALSLQEVDVYTKAYINTMAEFRRGVLALSELRARRHAKPLAIHTACAGDSQNPAIGIGASNSGVHREKRPRTAK